MERIVFFDGVCGLCNLFIDLLFKIDPKGVHKVAPLQGETAKRLLASERVQNLDTVVLYNNGEILTKSSAVINILSKVSIWGILIGLIMRLFPRFLRDLVYDFVVSSRYSVYGKLNTCRLPTEAEKSRFLP